LRLPLKRHLFDWFTWEKSRSFSSTASLSKTKDAVCASLLRLTYEKSSTNSNVQRLYEKYLIRVDHSKHQQHYIINILSHYYEHYNYWSSSVLHYIGMIAHCVINIISYYYLNSVLLLPSLFHCSAWIETLSSGWSLQLHETNIATGQSTAVIASFFCHAIVWKFIEHIMLVVWSFFWVLDATSEYEQVCCLYSRSLYSPHELLVRQLNRRVSLFVWMSHVVRQPVIHSSHASQFASSALLLIHLYLNFTPSLKTHLFQQSFPPYSVSRNDVISLALLTWFRDFLSHYFGCIIINHFIHLLYGLLKYTALIIWGNYDNYYYYN